MHKKLKKQGARAVALIAALVLAVYMGVFVGNRLFKKKVAPPVSGESTITFSTDNPDESKDNADNYYWTGLGAEPKKIIIDKLHVDTYIQKAGIDQNKAVAVPTNVHLAGWFAESPLPGQHGPTPTIIDGHVSGRTVDGVFKNLAKLVKNDSFEIELGNGKTLSYKVFDKVELKESDSVSYLFSQNPTVKSQVNLITCGGKFDRDVNKYENRVIVAAELID